MQYKYVILKTSQPMFKHIAMFSPLHIVQSIRDILLCRPKLVYSTFIIIFPVSYRVTAGGT